MSLSTVTWKCLVVHLKFNVAFWKGKLRFKKIQLLLVKPVIRDVLMQNLILAGQDILRCLLWASLQGFHFLIHSISSSIWATLAECIASQLQCQHPWETSLMFETCNSPRPCGQEDGKPSPPFVTAYPHAAHQQRRKRWNVMICMCR